MRSDRRRSLRFRRTSSAAHARCGRADSGREPDVSRPTGGPPTLSLSAPLISVVVARAVRARPLLDRQVRHRQSAAGGELVGPGRESVTRCVHRGRRHRDRRSATPLSLRGAGRRRRDRGQHGGRGRPPGPPPRDADAVDARARLVAGRRPVHRRRLLIVIPTTSVKPSLAQGPGRGHRRHPTAAPLVIEGFEDPTGETNRTAPSIVATMPSPAVQGATYTVQRGDSVFSIAADLANHDEQRTLDIADEILDLNLDTPMADGQRFSNPAYVELGWVCGCRRPSPNGCAGRGRHAGPTSAKMTCTWSCPATRCGTSPRTSTARGRSGTRSGRRTPATTWVADVRSTTRT